MKKRNILFALLLAMAMLVTACGGSQKSLEGKWIGSMDLTKQFEDGVKAAYPDLAEYVAFEGLTFKLDITFVEGQMTMTVQQDSIDAFHEKFETGMHNMAIGYWEAGIAMIDLTLEEAIIESGMTEEQYYNRIYRETGIDNMINSMTDVTNKTLEKLSGMKGMYTTPVDKELRLYYTEDTYESMGYSFKGKTLNITIYGDNFSLLIQCEENK